MTWPTFWTEDTGEEFRRLRRYAKADAADGHTHAAESVDLGRFPQIRNDDGYRSMADPAEYSGHPSWPLACGEPGCSYVFGDDDVWQVQGAPIYRALDGREWKMRELPVGAMYDAWWLPGPWKGADGIGLVCIVPEHHDWHVDAQASNCTRKCPWWDEDAQARHPEHTAQHNASCDPQYRNHKCWVRSGDPKAGTVHVDKDGETCAAGAGSILTPEWHGFLRHGQLVVT